MVWSWTSANPQLLHQRTMTSFGLPHSLQPALKSNNCGVPFVFSLMRAISRVGRASWARSGPRQVWQSYSVTVPPLPNMLSSFLRGLWGTRRHQQILSPRWRREQKERENREGPTTEATCASQGLPERGFLGIHCGRVFHCSLFFKVLAEPWLGVGLSLHPSQQELRGPHWCSNHNLVAAALCAASQGPRDRLPAAHSPFVQLERCSGWD